MYFLQSPKRQRERLHKNPRSARRLHSLTLRAPIYSSPAPRKWGSGYAEASFGLRPSGSGADLNVNTREKIAWPGAQAVDSGRLAGHNDIVIIACGRPPFRDDSFEMTGANAFQKRFKSVSTASRGPAPAPAPAPGGAIRMAGSSSRLAKTRGGRQAGHENEPHFQILRSR